MEELEKSSVLLALKESSVLSAMEELETDSILLPKQVFSDSEEVCGLVWCGCGGGGLRASDYRPDRVIVVSIKW
ncbi:hypothetical protein ACOSQ2_008909 [Xanthoceras sorbifolium]